jgi:hypothetical protein
MSTTVLDFFTRVAWDLHETDNSFDSGAWTVTEMIAYLNYAEKKFLEKTGILKSDDTIVADGSAIIFNRPNNTIDIDRIAVDGKALRRQTLFDFELEDRAWRSKTSGRPSYWHEDNLLNSQFELNKIPSQGATLRIFSDYIPDEYTDTTGNIHLNDEWEPYLRWKVISLALGKDGDNQDVTRSAYAEQRFMLGVNLAKRIMKGMASVNLRR